MFLDINYPQQSLIYHILFLKRNLINKMLITRYLPFFSTDTVGKSSLRKAKNGGNEWRHFGWKRLFVFSIESFPFGSRSLFFADRRRSESVQIKGWRGNIFHSAKHKTDLWQTNSGSIEHNSDFLYNNYNFSLT